jgi:hypothetical protein
MVHMGRTWQVLAVIGFFGIVGCGPADESEAEAVQGGEGVTVETGPPLPGAPADGTPAELPPDIDVIPTNE